MLLNDPHPQVTSSRHGRHSKWLYEDSEISLLRMPGLPGAVDKPDIPPPYLSSTYLERSLQINRRHRVQVSEQEVRKMYVRLGIEFFAHIKGWLWVKPLNRKKKNVQRILNCLFCSFSCCLFYANNTQLCLDTAQNSNDMRNSRNSGVYLDTNFSVMTSSIQYYVTALQINKTGISIFWIK